MAKQPSSPADFIVPLNMNGLEGRMLRVPPKNKRNREILLLYGHHALLERWWGLVENLNEYGTVTMPDLPGFGGMDSFYTIGKRPDLDAFADYLAAFVKLRYRRKRVTIVGISFGFVVATRMLQKYPELAKKIDLLVSVVGFMHKDDFLFSRNRRLAYRRITRLFATRPVALLIRYGGLNAFVIRTLYVKLPNAQRRFLEVDPMEFKEMVEFEVNLWQANDVRTHWLTTSEFLNLDHCNVKIDLPVWHVASKGDHWLNNYNVEQHMQIVFSGYNKAIADSLAHTPSILAGKKEMGVFVPPKLRRELAKKPKS
jgi:pimeloyl-ACP methyl ester carboxylesterase